MEIFRNLKKLGYKHYLPYTVEELDNLDIKSKEFSIEANLAFDWFREEHNLESHIKKDWSDGVCWGYESIIECIDGIIDCGTYKTYQEAQFACLRKLIEIVEQQKK